ncbi:hypothetical protein [Flavobacterium sp.]|uniref:hypothetical protein n=1 Tax=Flavobacterium sp. TaxID=239 RepID=UPI003D0E8878
MYYNYTTTCIGSELEGTQNLVAYGTGANAQEAQEQAIKNALNDVIFKGITAGKLGCAIKPLVFEVNAKEKNENFFSNFFSKNGDYNKYVLFTREVALDKEIQKTHNSIQGTLKGVVIKVLLSNLKQKLVQEGIIKSI